MAIRAKLAIQWLALYYMPDQSMYAAARGAVMRLAGYDDVPPAKKIRRTMKMPAAITCGSECLPTSSELSESVTSDPDSSQKQSHDVLDSPISS